MDDHRRSLPNKLLDHLAAQTRRLQPTKRAVPSTAELLYIFDQSPTSIVLKDRFNRIVYANATFAKQIGLPLDRMIDQSFFDLCPSEGASAFAEDVAVMTSTIPQRDIVRDVRVPSGATYRLRVDKFPRYDRLGRVIGVVVFVLDVTEQMRTEQKLATLVAKEHTARLQAERLGRIKDEFLITLSHELRTPLTPIIGWTELLLSGDINAGELPNILQTIRRNAKSELTLIDNLLDTASIMSGSLRLDLAPVDLARLTRDVCEQQRPAAEAKQISFLCETGAAVGSCMVLGDDLRLHQMLEHIVANAIKFTPPHGTVRTTAERQGGSVCLRIVDTGVGIKPDYLPYVFDRFSQADGSTTRNYPGLGIGLTLVRHIAEAHKGTISVASAGESRGTTFVLNLPALASVTAAATAAVEAANGGTPVVPARKTLDGFADRERTTLAHYAASSHSASSDHTPPA